MVLARVFSPQLFTLAHATISFALGGHDEARIKGLTNHER